MSAAMTEFAIAADGVRIAYEVVGEGEPVVLVHGFASHRGQNWRETGWYKTLTGAGLQVVALDCRGHGESDKPHDPAAYGESVMADDIRLVIAAAGLTRADVMGYSMGAMLTLRLAYDHPECVTRAILGGVGDMYLSRENSWRAGIADAIGTDDTSQLSPMQWMFREFAGQKGKDVEALAACMRAPRKPLTEDELATIRTPMLVVAGSRDLISGPPNALAAALGNAKYVTVSDRDHMLTVGDKAYKDAAVAFLQAV